ncbi:MAG: pantoate--beta-alanine ligase [Synergistaceae bacterium]|nr:pantoate--beta-alanine ligase [Synergistaceae bacterium]MDD4750608.1 pantoate--beta-alanine ligase [Synergistaceae bacterium]MDD4838423.1 pantoate--beta-alanine ligase [Synergistaceae bacterium]
MIISGSVQETRKVIGNWKKRGFSVGLVPTMGYLHPGHISLIERARKENDMVVVSIFVNPIQFGPNEDLDKYPRDMAHDREVCEKAGAELIFAPEPSEMYPSENLVFVDIKELGNGLCGAKRPGHFRGVCTVVSKLFNIVLPDRAYFGEKDAQQLAIIRRMVKDLNFGTEIVSCPIVREPDGLAMSSRNLYLSPEERKAALSLSRSLSAAKELMRKGEKDAVKIREAIVAGISAEPLVKIDYAEIVDSADLSPVEKIEKPVLAAAAVYFGKTRLIDNFTFEGDTK